ncbi:MAG: hypothetical protein PHX25_02980, partial [Candidatus Pacebacteria bacterium]|nr:hypothetical protein [Candidatus Paceibacterota bacterium]
MSKYGHRTQNWFEAIVNKIGGEERAEAFLRGELIVREPDRRWTIDSDGVIRFSVIGLGLSGPKMEKHLVSKGHENSDYAKQILNSPNYVSCEKDKVYNLAVLPGKLFLDDVRTTGNIRVEGDRRNLIHGENLPTEIGTLVRLSFTNKEIEQMGLVWLIAMHKPMKDSDGGL